MSAPAHDYAGTCDLVELRQKGGFPGGLVDVTPNDVNGMVEIFIDLPTTAYDRPAVANLRFDPAQAAAIGRALVAAAAKLEESN